MTGTGRFISMPEKDVKEKWQKQLKTWDAIVIAEQDSEPERYYDWMLWKMQQEEKHKEANKIYYAIKGQLIPDTWSQKDIDRMLKHYTKRLWGNNERLVYIEERFEKAWKQKYE